MCHIYTRLILIWPRTGAHALMKSQVYILEGGGGCHGCRVAWCFIYIDIWPRDCLVIPSADIKNSVIYIWHKDCLIRS